VCYTGYAQVGGLCTGVEQNRITFNFSFETIATIPSEFDTQLVVFSFDLCLHILLINLDLSPPMSSTFSSHFFLPCHSSLFFIPQTLTSAVWVMTIARISVRMVSTLSEATRASAAPRGHSHRSTHANACGRDVRMQERRIDDES